MVVGEEAGGKRVRAESVPVSVEAGPACGMGSLLYRDGSAYLGQLERNRPHGFGMQAEGTVGTPSKRLETLAPKRYCGV